MSARNREQSVPAIVALVEPSEPAPPQSRLSSLSSVPGGDFDLDLDLDMDVRDDEDAGIDFALADDDAKAYDSLLDLKGVADTDTKPATLDDNGNPRAHLIPNPGWIHVRSWRRVPVPPGRAVDLAEVQAAFKPWVEKCLPGPQTWSGHTKAARQSFLDKGMEKWPVMKCYVNAWPLEAIARYYLTKRVRQAPQQSQRTITTRKSASTRSRVSKRSPAVSSSSRASSLASGSGAKTASSSIKMALRKKSVAIQNSTSAIPISDIDSEDVSVHDALYTLIGAWADDVAPLFTKTGMRTGKNVFRFTRWTKENQLMFLKRDILLSPYEAMELLDHVELSQQ